MSTEKILREKNETLRIVGMYSFLFYVVACAVFVILKGDIPTWAIAVAAIPFVGFCVFTVIWIKKIYEKSDEETQKKEVPAAAQTDCNDKNQEIKMKAEVSFEQQIN